MSLAELKEYEKEFDRLIDELPIWPLPVRPLLTALHLTVDSLFNGSRLDGSVRPRPEAGSALGARLSYLVPHLLKCDAEPIGRNGADALRALNDSDPEGICRFALVTYGHFCELMPEVHKGYYSVAGDKEKGFTLAHATRQFADHEATDIILTELSLSFLASPAMADWLTTPGEDGPSPWASSSRPSSSTTSTTEAPGRATILTARHRAALGVKRQFGLQGRPLACILPARRRMPRSAGIRRSAHARPVQRKDKKAERHLGGVVEGERAGRRRFSSAL